MRAVIRGSRSQPDVSGKPVTVIGDGAFISNFYKALNDEPYVEKVKLPDSITEIGGSAFPFVKEINLPNGLKVIGADALMEFGAEELDDSGQCGGDRERGIFGQRPEKGSTAVFGSKDRTDAVSDTAISSKRS